MNYLSRRCWLGALLFLIFVGEPTVGFKSGLFTNPASLLALICLYLILFMLYEALALKYTLSNLKLILLTFGIYSVIVTGLLHGELADYHLHPNHDLGTTLIRIQCSLFVPFAYYLLNKVSKRDPSRVLPISKVIVIAVIYILLLSLTHKFGITKLTMTFKQVPVTAFIYTILGIVAIVTALKKGKPGNLYRSSWLTFWTWILLIIAIIPIPALFIVLVILMPIVTIFYLRSKSWRDSLV